MKNNFKKLSNNIEIVVGDLVYFDPVSFEKRVLVGPFYSFICGLVIRKVSLGKRHLR